MRLSPERVALELRCPAPRSHELRLARILRRYPSRRHRQRSIWRGGFLQWMPLRRRYAAMRAVVDRADTARAAARSPPCWAEAGSCPLRTIANGPGLTACDGFEAHRAQVRRLRKNSKAAELERKVAF